MAWHARDESPCATIRAAGRSPGDPLLWCEAVARSRWLVRVAPSYPPRRRVGGAVANGRHGRQWETWNEIPVAHGRLDVGRNDIGRTGARPRGKTRGQTRNQGGRTAATRPRGGAEQVLPVPHRCDVP